MRTRASLAAADEIARVAVAEKRPRRLDERDLISRSRPPKLRPLHSTLGKEIPVSDELLSNLRNPWLLVGLAGQAVFSARFLVQWIQSERAGRSLIPDLFWNLSLVGSALLLAYALHRRDPVFALGQSAGFVVYARNLALRRREIA
jgi:lipid-A-disaccharide synthase-like uncharacterized protein